MSERATPNLMPHKPHDNPPSPGPQTLPWEYAGLLLTYWCNARCAFCYVHSGPDRGGDMPVDEAVRIWRGLDELAGDHGHQMRIHLAGGEPFGDWPRLVGIIRAARDAGCTPLEKVETNAFWAIDDHVTRSKLELLDALGMEQLIVSADVYHQEFVPFERVKRCVEWARRVLGRGRVRVRWWDFFNEPREARSLSPARRDALYREALARHEDRLTGRAALELAQYFPLYRVEHFRSETCAEAILGSRHVHIDADGNVFSGICTGIIVGNVKDQSPHDAWHALADGWRARPLVSALVTGGSYAVYEQARAFGYEPRAEGYANKCHLCTDVREFLFERGVWPEEVGPSACYATAAEREAAAARSRRVALTIGGRPASSSGA